MKCTEAAQASTYRVFPLSPRDSRPAPDIVLPSIQNPEGTSGPMSSAKPFYAASGGPRACQESSGSSYAQHHLLLRHSTDSYPTPGRPGRILAAIPYAFDEMAGAECESATWPQFYRLLAGAFHSGFSTPTDHCRPRAIQWNLRGGFLLAYCRCATASIVPARPLTDRRQTDVTPNAATFYFMCPMRSLRALISPRA